MSKHTPGPWEASQTDIFGEPAPYMQIFPESRTMFGHETSLSIATMNCMEFDEQKANARLIAASPELLEALEEAISMLGSRLIKDTFGYDWHEKATAAIAKARGEP